MRSAIPVFKTVLCLTCVLILAINAIAQDSANPSQPVRKRARELGVHVGILPVGQHNAITDVEGVAVGHQTIVRGDSIRTGVTVVRPHADDVFQQKVPAAVHVGNGFGKLAGSTQVDELGNIETSIALTNTLSVAVAMQGLIQHTLEQPGNENARSVNAIVGETNDGYLNDIRGMHVQPDDVMAALKNAKPGAVEEGCVGAGTGTVCFGFKGGIGTSSRVLPDTLGGHTVGVLVQSNFGGVLQINGAPVGRELGKFSFSRFADSKSDGSCMIVVATDAPLSNRNLKRLAQRALFGMARTGSIMSNGSGDYVIAFSTAYRITANGHEPKVTLLSNERMSPLFLAVAEATEEAIYNSMFAATKTTGIQGKTIESLPVDTTLEIIKTYNLSHLNERLPSINQR